MRRPNVVCYAHKTDSCTGCTGSKAVQDRPKDSHPGISTKMKMTPLLLYSVIGNILFNIYDNFCNKILLSCRVLIITHYSEWFNDFPVPSRDVTNQTLLGRTEKKISSYIKKFRWERLQSHIWGKASAQIFSHIWGGLSHIRLCSCSLLDFLKYEENIVFFFISAGII